MKEKTKIDTRIVSVGLFSVAVVLFMIGFHNVDNAFNMTLIDEWDFDVDLKGDINTAKDMYVSGLKFFTFSLALFLGAFILAIK